MGTLVKLSVGVAVTGIALALWWHEAGDAGRSRAADSKTPTPVALQSPPPGMEHVDGRDMERRESREPLVPPTESVETAHAEEVDAVPSKASTASLERDLERVTETFLGENFDAAGLLELWLHLAQSMPETTEDGKLELGSLRGSYTFKDGSYQVQLTSTCAREPFVKRTISLLFADARGTASNLAAFVQFHPRGVDADQSSFENERIVGWGLQVDPDHGTTARALTQRFDGARWQLGNMSEAFPEQHLPGLRSRSAFDAWLARLRPRR